MTATTSHLTEPGPPVTLCPSSDQPLEQRERQWLWARGLALRPGSASSKLPVPRSSPVHRADTCASRRFTVPQALGTHAVHAE